MGLVYRFTDGSTSASVSGAAADHGGAFTGTPWDTTRTGVVARSRPTTRQGIHDEIVLAAVAAGFTQHALVGTAGANDDTFESTGEDANGNTCWRLQQQTSGRYIFPYVGPKLDSSNNLQGAIGGTLANVYDRWDLGAADFTADMHILACKDWLWAVAQNTNHTSSMFSMFVGNLLPYDVNPNVLTLASAASAGNFVTLDFTGSNPLTLGYRPGDLFTIVECAKSAATAKAETTLIIAVTSTSIKVRTLLSSYAVGAKAGGAPVNIARMVQNNTEMETSAGVLANCTSPYLFGGLSPVAGGLAANNSLPGGTILNVLRYALLNTYTAAGQEFGSATTPNNRTLRFTGRSVAAAIGGSGGVPGAFAGRLPGLLAHPGTIVYYPHDPAQADRVSPAEDYVPFRFTAASAQNYLLGPTPP